ncbi:MAG: hypothetical protein EBX60_02835, partial [Betaproteobacteria bacterium]|nr:hypothetical protein [Betaproteobacteria bacterium]
MSLGWRSIGCARLSRQKGEQSAMVRIGDSLKGQRVLITQSKAFMGPALCECFENHGARVIADNTNPQDAPAFAAMAEAVVAQGPIDAVIANLALPSPQTRCHQVSD